MPYKKFCVILYVPFLFLGFSVSAETELVDVLPADRFFEQGLRINGTKHGDPFRLVDTEGKTNADAKPIWSVAQWHSQGKLDKVSVDGETVKLFDDFKSLTIDRKTGSFNMTVWGGKEYAEGARADGKTPWIHLLLSQGSTMKTPMLHTLDRLVVELEFEMTQFHSVLESPSRFHAAQFQLFLYLRGVDREKPGKYKNFTWFGISVFDNRKDFTDDYAAQDFAMQNGQFIYTIGSKHTLKDKVEVGRRLKIEIDILPYVKKCLVAGHEKGFMLGTEYEDTLFDGMNIGWEVPGVFDCGITVHRFTVTPVSGNR